MTIANDLLQASVSWRGHPATFTPGALGDVGARFTRAFDRMMDDPVRQPPFIFEYFAGLLFNGDYSNLETLTALIDSWLCPAPGGNLLVLRETIIGLVYRYALGDAIIKLSPGWYVAHKVVWTDFPFTYASNLMFFLPVVAYVRGTDSVIGEYSLYYCLNCTYNSAGELTRDGISGRLRIELLDIPNKTYDAQDSTMVTPPADIPQGFQEDGLPSKLALSSYWKWLNADHVADLWYPRDLDIAVARDAFRQEVVDAASMYHAGEVADNRSTPSIAATATAANGYVFANWAQGKFGSPVAQEVG